MRTTLAALALATGIGAAGIGGTGHAALAAASDRCAALAGTDRTACESLESAAETARRTVALDAMSRTFRGPRLAAFARLVAAQRAFAHAIAVDESADGAGSSDAAAAERAATDAFAAAVRGLLGGRAPREAASFAAVDAALNDAYARVMSVDDAADLAWGRVDKAGIRRTERAWLVYRDAFVAFARTLDAPDAATAVRTELTRERTASLEGFLAD